MWKRCEPGDFFSSSKYVNQFGLHFFLNNVSHLPRFLSQWTVRHREAMSGEEHRGPVRRQVHQEAPEHSQLAGREAGGDRARGGHPAADPAPQHCDAPRGLREPHRCGSHPGAVSDSRERYLQETSKAHPGWLSAVASLAVSCLTFWPRRNLWVRKRPLSSSNKSWRVSTTSTPEKSLTLTSRFVCIRTLAAITVALIQMNSVSFCCYGWFTLDTKALPID